jgi:hypothetical protein
MAQNAEPVRRMDVARLTDQDLHDELRNGPDA